MDYRQLFPCKIKDAKYVRARKYLCERDCPRPHIGGH